jgi:hypothetical protein
MKLQGLSAVYGKTRNGLFTKRETAATTDYAWLHQMLASMQSRGMEVKIRTCETADHERRDK